MAALWLLLRLRLYGWLRRLARGLQSPRGLIFAIVGVFVLALWLLPSLMMLQSASAEQLARIRRIGPLALFALAFINVLFSSGQGGVTFTAPEVNFLFPAPFSRRQLLAYKIVGNLGIALFSALFISVFVRRLGVLTSAVFVGVVLMLFFLQLFSTLLSLLASTVGAAAYNRQRRLLLGLLFIAAGVVVYLRGDQWLQGDWQTLLDGVLDNPVVQTILAPMAWYIRTLTAETIWPELVLWGGLAALANLALVGLIMLLDASYLEASAAASEKTYVRLQRLRQGVPAALSLPAGKARLGVPFWPRLGGVGPLVWRQLTTAVRSLNALVLVVIVLAVFLMPMLMRLPADEMDAVPVLSVAILAALTLIVPPLLPFDFRGDLERLSLLKTLPLPAWRIAAGEVLAPVLLLTIGQLGILAVVHVLRGLTAEIWGLAIFLLPINFLIFSLENLFFLLFPTRHIAAGPGDFQLFGRNILVWLAKMTAMLLAFVPAIIAGVVVFIGTGQNLVLAFASAWCVTTAVVACTIPLLAWAFNRFDVARDTPPE